MDIKGKAKNLRGKLQEYIYKVINPAVRVLIKAGVSPNTVTTVGFLGNLAGACVLVYAGIHKECDLYELMAWAGGIMLVSSVFDMMDGQVARIGKSASPFGALYDSVLDRYSELVTLGAVCLCLSENDFPVGGIVTFAALIGSLMVSYVRARAEGLGLECKIGLMQRPERVVLTCAGLLACGIAGMQEKQLPFDPMWLLLVPMGFIALFANLTAFARMAYSRKQLLKK